MGSLMSEFIGREQIGQAPFSGSTRLQCGQRLSSMISSAGFDASSESICCLSSKADRLNNVIVCAKCAVVIGLCT